MLLGICPPCGFDVMGHQPHHQNVFGQVLHKLCWDSLPLVERGRLQRHVNRPEETVHA